MSCKLRRVKRRGDLSRLLLSLSFNRLFILNPVSTPNFFYTGNKALNLLNGLNRSKRKCVCVCGKVFFCPLIQNNSIEILGDIKDYTAVLDQGVIKIINK